MTTISATPILGSIASNTGRKIASLALRYPRPIHAELMTHRAFSRNASSSRAVPIKKLIAEAEHDYAEPLHWGLNERGMQATAELEGADLQTVKREWHRARKAAIDSATVMASCNASKQLVNRLLEPFTHISVIVTSTDWRNFLALRDDGMAEPHIRLLAIEIRKALETMEFQELHPGEWHLPYVERQHLWKDGTIASRDKRLEIFRQISAARCARVSYLNHEGEPATVDEDRELYQRLTNPAHKLHASPMEHQATPDVWGNEYESWDEPSCHGNLRGFIQFRKTLVGEATPGFM